MNSSHHTKIHAGTFVVKLASVYFIMNKLPFYEASLTLQLKSFYAFLLIGLILLLPQLSRAERSVFTGNYFDLGMQNSIPTVRFADQYYRAYNHFSLGYSRIDPESHWLSIAIDYRPFRSPDDDSLLVLWAFSQSVFHLLRVYHPWYLAMGGQLIYLYPADGAKFPPSPHHEVSSEVGVGAGWGIVYAFNSRLLASASVLRWRGINSQRVQGFQFSLSLHVGI